MIHLARRITRGDLAAAPGRSAAIAVLLVAAAWLPTTTGTDRGYGLALASVVCAVLGGLALDEARFRLLEQNGARRSATGLVAAASIVPPAVAATALALGLGLVLSPSPATLDVVLAALLVPVLSAPVAVWVSRRASSDAAAGRPAGWLPRLGRTTAGALFVLVALAMPALGIALVALKLTAGSWSSSRPRRALGALLAVAIVAAAVEMVGHSSTWWDLGLALLWTGAGLAVAVVVLGIHAVSLGAGAASHVGPRARLALAPLVGRRRSLAPLVGVISFVAALSVSEAVVGASFGQREADREQRHPHGHGRGRQPLGPGHRRGAARGRGRPAGDRGRAGGRHRRGRRGRGAGRLRAAALAGRDLRPDRTSRSSTRASSCSASGSRASPTARLRRPGAGSASWRPRTSLRWGGRLRRRRSTPARSC